MRDKISTLTATTALVSCLSLVVPQAPLAQSSNANAANDKLPVCAQVEEGVPCREPGKSGEAKDGEAADQAEAPDEAADPAEVADEVADPAEAPDEVADPAEAAEPVKPKPRKSDVETAKPETPAETAPGAKAEKPGKPKKDKPAAETAEPTKPKKLKEQEPEVDTAEPEAPKQQAPATETAKPGKPKKLKDQEPALETAEPEVPAEEAPAAETAKPAKPKLEEPEVQTAEPEAPEQDVDKTETATQPAAEQEDSTAEVKQTAPGASGKTPAALSGEGEPAEVEETQVTDQTARTSDEEFATKADTKGDAKTETQVKTSKQSSGGGGDDGLSNLEKFALGAAGLVALDALLGSDDEVVTNSGDRVVVRRDGQLEVYRDDNELLRRPGSDVRTETYSDGSTRTVVIRDNGTQIVTITDATGRVLRRTKIRPNGTEVVLLDDTRTVREVDVRSLPKANKEYVFRDGSDRDALRAALRADAAGDLDRTFSLYQVRNIPQVRELMPEITVDAINFQTDSAAIRPREAEELRALGLALREFLDENPDEVFLIEGHTDAVGSAAYNLALSDRRAESVALALTEYFDVPPENMVIQGYGESQLRVETEGPARENRRAVVRRITPLLEQSRS